MLDQKVFNLNPDYFSYTVSKLALERAVALQAQALAPAVRVCGVAPGILFRSGPQTQANFERAAPANLLRRPIDPADVARSLRLPRRHAQRHRHHPLRRQRPAPGAARRATSCSSSTTC